MEPSPALPRAVLWRYLIPAAVIAAAVVAWWGDAYWNYSDGVYLLTARNLDAGLYSDIAAAQPPPLYWLGAAILAMDDSVLAARIAMAAVAVVSGLLVAVAVWRLTASRNGAVLAGLAALVVPWHLHESLTLTPETVAAPLLLGAALLAARSPHANLAAGVLAGVAACVKLAFILPAAALVLGARARSRYVGAALVTAGGLGLLSLALYGGDLWDNVVTAQRQTGTRGFDKTGPLLAQAAWNLGPLLILAGLALWQRARLRDQPLVRTLTAVLGGGLLLIPTVFKVGTSLNLIVVAEPAAIALGASAVVVLLGAERVRATRLALVAAAACAVLLAVESAALVANPEHPRGFARPFSALAYQRTLSDDEVAAAARAARACPPGEAFSGPPYVAFVAGRRMPGNQPDTFIIDHAKVHEDEARAAVADVPVCP